MVPLADAHFLEPHTSERVGGMLDVDVSTDSDVKNFPGGKMTRLARAGQLLTHRHFILRVD